MTTSSAGVAHGIAYVLAKDPSEAYRILRNDLDERDIGFSTDRELDRIELIADNAEYPLCGTRVYVAPAEKSVGWCKTHDAKRT